jgi:uncharacterized protein YndB with AHSA1/START domain
VFTNIAKHPDGSTILEGLTTVTFAEDGAGKTKLTVSTRALAIAAATARMEEGWKQSLERLADHIAEKHKTIYTKPSDREMVFTRLFDAPRELVFKMWTDPKHIVQWWGPRGFSTTSLEMDVRPGGSWRLVMHGPDGVDYKNKIVYSEVVEPERLVYRHTGEAGYEPVKIQVTVTFEDRGGKTDLMMRMVFESAAERENVIKKYGADKGAVETLARLQKHLATLVSILPG